LGYGTIAKETINIDDGADGTNVGLTIGSDAYIFRSSTGAIQIDTKLGIGRAATTHALEVQGTIYATSNIYANQSDIRLKTNRQRIKNAGSILKNLNGYSFLWNNLSDKDKRGKFDYGLIAQEVRNQIPEVVYLDPDGYFGISTDKLIPFIIEALNELQDEVNILKRKNDEDIIN